jgi:2-oxoglutarate ferredoxin oxidoreductase subunit alpha
MSRGGPGLGNIAPSQADYFQATRGGGHGDYRNIVLAPHSGQELADLTALAFDLGDRYRMPALVLGDGMLGQMMEPVEFPPEVRPDQLPPKPWALTGARGRPSRYFCSLYLDPAVEEAHNWKLMRKYEEVARNETRWETFEAEDAEILIVAFGTAARIAKGAIKRAREQGLKVGLFRPVTVWPFPSKALLTWAGRVKRFFVFELNMGQMVEDVRLALEGAGEVGFYGRPGGSIPTPRDVLQALTNHLEGKGGQGR